MGRAVTLFELESVMGGKGSEHGVGEGLLWVWTSATR